MTQTLPLILVTEKFATESLIKLQTELKESYEVKKINALTEMDAQAHLVTGLIIRSKTKITKDFLTKTPHLKFIITCTSGFDHIDLEATEKNNIQVMYTPDANAQAAAELTWGLMLACQRHILEAHKNIKQGQWNREILEGHELAGLTLGIIGLGRIGQKVLSFAKAFSMNVIVFDPYQDDAIFQKYNLERSSYEEVLKQSDILTFHVPLTKETTNMFNRSHLDYVHPDVVVINTSRGSVVNEDDLAIALEQQKIKAAGLDVFAKEPLTRESKLLKSPSVILTQHMGALTEQAFKKASSEACHLCINYLKNNVTQNSLPLKNNWGSLMFQD